MEQACRDRVAVLFEQSHERLFKVAARLSGSNDWAEDIVQESFIVALVRSKDFMVHPNQEAWLTQVVHYMCKNFCKRSSLTEASLDTIFYLAAPEADHGLLELLPKDLPEHYKQILIWRFETKMDYRMIADRLGISEAGCRSRVLRAEEKCRELMIKNGLLP